MDVEITLEQLVNQYFGNADDYFIIKQQEKPPPQQKQEQEEGPKVFGWNSVPNPTDITPPKYETAPAQMSINEEGKEET